MILAGLDLAWKSEKNPSAISFGRLDNHFLTVSKIDSAVWGIESILNKIHDIGSHGIAIDAPLIIKNNSGQRNCERLIGREYSSRGASCHTSNLKLYPKPMSVNLSVQLLESGFNHLIGNCWQIECYPHPAIIEIFGLNRRLKYKKGTVAEKRTGQKYLATLIKKRGYAHDS